MNAFVTARDGKAERFIVEVIAVTGAGGNPDFSVRITHPSGEVYSQLRDHDGATALFQNMLDASCAEVFKP